MNRYASQHPLRDEALGKIACVQRGHAVLNDNALPKLREPLSLDDYKASRVIADPLRLLDSVMFCDGANALVITTRDLPNAPQFAVTMTKWNLKPTFSAQTFVFTPPAGAKKLDFLPR